MLFFCREPAFQALGTPQPTAALQTKAAVMSRSRLGISALTSSGQCHRLNQLHVSARSPVPRRMLMVPEKHTRWLWSQRPSCSVPTPQPPGSVTLGKSLHLSEPRCLWLQGKQCLSQGCPETVVCTRVSPTRRHPLGQEAFPSLARTPGGRWVRPSSCYSTFLSVFFFCLMSQHPTGKKDPE